MSALDSHNADRRHRRAIGAAVRAALIAITTAGAAVWAGCATAAPRAATAVSFADADSTTSTSIAPGVTHTFVRDARGPWAFHVVEVDTRRCQPLLEARKPGTMLSERARTSTLATGAIAGINADFFMIPGGTPRGPHVHDGVPLIGPTDRPVFAITSDGWSIGHARISGRVRVGVDSAAIVQVNRPPRPANRRTRPGATLFTSWIGDSVAADSAARRLRMRMLDGDEAAGRAVIIASDSAVDVIEMEDGTAVLLAHGAGRQWARRRAVGDTVVWQVQVTVESPAMEAVGGFPELMRDGRPVLDEQTVGASFRNTRHPRTAIGWTPDQRLLLVVVDGRQPGWSVGMSLDELTWLFQRLGASDALNLDGGGSTAMVVNGAVANRPSDREGERAVGNALALAGCR